MKFRQFLLGVCVAGAANAANIERATITEVFNSVRVIDAASNRATPAKLQAMFAAPDLIRTGPESRAELTAADQTVTRVGQNTIFSFSRDSREVELQKGSLLFQSPSGKGGGTIRTPAASAAVLGTTLIVVATKNGGFKVLLLEGKGRVRANDGTVRNLNSGQMVYALPGGKLSGVFEFRLSQQVAASALVSGFKKKLASSAKIQAAIAKQEKEIASGKAVDTGLLASGSPSVAFKVDVITDSRKKQDEDMEVVAASRFQTAATTPAAVAQPTLDAARVFTPESADPIEFPGDNRPVVFAADDNAAQRVDNYAQYIAQNITYDTTAISLTEYSDRQAFRFLALEDVVFNQSLDLGTYPGAIQIWAGGTVDTAEGQPVRVTVSAPAVVLSAFGDSFSTSEPLPTSVADFSTEKPLRLEGFTMQNEGGSLSLLAGRTEFRGVRLAADSVLRIGTTEDLFIAGTTTGATAPPFTTQSSVDSPTTSVLAAREQVVLRSGRDLGLQNTAVVAPSIRLQAGRHLALRQVQITDSGNSGTSLNGPHAVLVTAQNLADVRQVNFNTNDLLMQARTIKLQNVNFRLGSLIVLESDLGVLAANPNTGRPAVPGRVNFISGVRYGGAPAQQAVIQNGPGSPTGTQGIVIRPINSRTNP